MKTLIKSLALAFSLAVVTSVYSFANATATNPIGRPSKVATYKTGIYTTASGKLNIALDKETNGRVDIRLKDTTGKVLYAQYLGKRDKGCRLSLNLSDLEDGTYTVEISNGAETTTQNVVLSTNQPTTPNRLVAIN
ncbi:T9SS type A sorting domain-containing protein [Spirosoma pulveris]